MTSGETWAVVVDGKVTIGAGAESLARELHRHRQWSSLVRELDRHRPWSRLRGAFAALRRLVGRTRDARDADWRREARRRIAQHRYACHEAMLQRFPDVESLRSESWVVCLDGVVTVGVGVEALTRCLDAHKAARGEEAQLVRLGFASWTLRAPRRKGAADV